MGYDLYITRKQDWSDTDGHDITLDDWMGVIAVDRSLQVDPQRAAAVDPRVASGAKEPSHAVWLDWPERRAGTDEAWIWLERGNLVATDPDQRVRQKMFLIAVQLDARLMGEDGEVYDSIGEPESRLSALGVLGLKKRWWKFW